MPGQTPQLEEPAELRASQTPLVADEKPVYPSDLSEPDSEKIAQLSIENKKDVEKHAIIEGRDNIVSEAVQASAPSLLQTDLGSVEANLNADVDTSENTPLNTQEQGSEMDETADAVTDVRSEQDSPNAVTDTEVSYTHKSMQRQIREKQKQLSNQMLALISMTTDRVNNSVPETTASFDVEPVEAVIETAEQEELLQQARLAFDERNFDVAEEKYLQLMTQLPELPDVVGELANVYRIQNRQTDYIAMNTRFVKRLTEHYRFDEAWRVVSETNKVDQQSANKQRRIIYKKQKELGN